MVYEREKIKDRQLTISNLETSGKRILRGRRNGRCDCDETQGSKFSVWISGRIWPEATTQSGQSHPTISHGLTGKQSTSFRIEAPHCITLDLRSEVKNETFSVRILSIVIRAIANKVFSGMTAALGSDRPMSDLEVSVHDYALYLGIHLCNNKP